MVGGQAWFRCQILLLLLALLLLLPLLLGNLRCRGCGARQPHGSCRTGLLGCWRRRRRGRHTHRWLLTWQRQRLWERHGRAQQAGGAGAAAADIHARILLERLLLLLTRSHPCSRGRPWRKRDGCSANEAAGQAVQLVELLRATFVEGRRGRQLLAHVRQQAARPAGHTLPARGGGGARGRARPRRGGRRRGGARSLCRGHGKRRRLHGSGSGRRRNARRPPQRRPGRRGSGGGAWAAPQAARAVPSKHCIHALVRRLCLRGARPLRRALRGDGVGGVRASALRALLLLLMGLGSRRGGRAAGRAARQHVVQHGQRAVGELAIRAALQRHDGAVQRGVLLRQAAERGTHRRRGRCCATQWQRPPPRGKGGGWG